VAKWQEFLATVRGWYAGTFAPEDRIEGLMAKMATLCDA
jgi:hypothetical protein